MPSVHSMFSQDAKVIIVRPESRYFGKRGVVYGSGSTRSGTDPAGVIWVRMEDSGDCKKFLPSRLALIPKAESAYKVSSKTRSGRNVMIHEVPGEARGRPSLEKLLAGLTTDS